MTTNAERSPELSASDVERTRAAEVQHALYRIAELASAAQDLQEFYAAVHAVVGELMHANNFYIALFDEERQLVNWPYYVDDLDPDPPDPNQWDAFGEGDARGTTAYVLRTGEPQLLDYERQSKLLAQGEIELVGVLTEDTSWLGVPLKAEGQAVGVLVVQSYTKDVQYSEQDKELLAFVGQHVGAALSRARAIEETRQRNAELAVINAVQEALAGELELQAIYDVVGEKLREVFDAQVIDIAVYDEASGLLHFPYSIERGVRFPDEPHELFGFRKHVLETRETLLIDEDVFGASQRFGNPVIGSGEMPKSALLVPLVAGGKATGAISLQNFDREHAFTESDQRLLETLTRSLSVALENARLVHETRQRNAELALINNLQESIAGELELQAIYDLVGDKLQEVFDAQVVDIGIFDFDAGLTHYPYTIERGVRYPDEPVPIMRSPTTRLLFETRAPVVINDVAAWELERDEQTQVLQGEPSLSMLIAPLTSGDELRGRISLQNLDRTNAFSENDVRLLATLAGSLSVALDNARLVHETRQRNAELALINSAQAAIAGELDEQAIYDRVGGKIEEVYDAQVVSISTFDETTGLLRFPYVIERGERYEVEPLPVVGFRKHVLESGEPLLINENVVAEAERYGNPLALAGEVPKSVLFVPLFTGGRPSGVISLQNVDREHAFSETDQRLLLTLAGNISSALDNARLVRETRERAAELGTVNSVGQALASQLELDALIELVGERVRETFDADIAYVALHDEAAGQIDFAYYHESGERRSEPSLEYGQGLTSQILDSRQPLLLIRDQQYEGLALLGTRSRSYLGVPILAGEKAIGVISVQSIHEEGRFDESDVRLLSTIAANVGVAIQNARLYVETRRRANETAALAELGREVSAMLDLESVLERIGERAQALLEADTSAVYLAEEDGETLRATIALGQDADEIKADAIPIGEGIIGDLAARGAAEVINDTGSDPRAVTIPGTSEEEQGALLAAPLLARERVIGMMAVWRYAGTRFTEEDLSFLIGLSQQAAIAIENARLFEEQREAERKYRELVEELPLTVYRDFPDVNATSEYVSPKVETMFGYPPDAWMDSEFFPTVLHPDDRDRVLAEQETWLSGDFDRWTNEYRVIAADGRTVWVRDDAWIVKDAEGTPSRVHGFMIDITEQMLAHGEIRRQKQYFESLVDVSPVAIVVMDADERVTGWNPAATELFGWSAEEAVGKHIDDLVFGDESHEEGREVTREALATGRAQRMGRRKRRDGAVADVELMLVPLTVDGRHVGFYAIYHDITELQRAREEAEAATQAKSAFLATMSHEIRTPMNAVIGMTGLLLGTELTDEQREFADVVRSSGDALLHVIDDILDYSKIEAGKLELEREPVDLRECVEGALEIVAPRAWEKAIELGCLFDEDVPTGIVGDAGRLRQVLLNLLSNGVKFTDEGEVVVHVDAESSGPRSYRLDFAVRDTGIGIPKDRMDKLFESFSQVDASTTRRYGGTGLGLAISKRLVELMGGTLRVESEVGEGSTFRIALPVEAADVPSRAAEEDALPQLARKRVLVVDDNATNREIVTRHARSWGMEPVAVEAPGDALARIAGGETFDVAVLDMMMPEMDGVALAREIRGHRDELELPLVLLTSLGRLPQEESAREFAVQLAKPVRSSQLYNALLKALSAQAPESADDLSPEEAKPATSSLRILLAEDNAVNQKVALRLLEQLGYRADVVWNGREVIEALERQPYDVVLMDVQMPELDGLDASRRICERWAPEARPRIVAMTANVMPEDREACFAAGMDDYVAKPIHVDELAKALSRARPLAEAHEEDGREARVELDASAVASLRDLGGDEFVAEVVDTFLDDAPALLATLRASLETADAEELRRAAHTLKSNGQTFGAQRFSELCRDLEEHARRGELEGADGLVDRVVQEYEALETALAELRPQPAS